MAETMAFCENLAINVPPASTAVIKQQVLHHPQMDPREAMAEAAQLTVASSVGDGPDDASSHATCRLLAGPLAPF